MFGKQTNKQTNSIARIAARENCIDRSRLSVAAKDLEAPKVVSGCPLRKCMSNKYCEFGYQVDEKGCRTCSCKDDPCEVGVVSTM